MNYKQYDIWLADLNPRFGTESGKTRPILVIQSNLLNTAHPSVIICPITTNVRKDVRILRVNLKKNTAGLNKESAVMIDQVRAIDRKRLLKKLGDLPQEHRKKVVENLKIVLDLI